MVRTSGTAAALSMLASTAQTWGWKAEAGELWWLLAVRPAGARPALERLWKLASDARDSAAMLKVAKRIVELEATRNTAALNNLAWLLLLRGEERPRALSLAEENLARAPASPGIHVTAALARSFEGRHDEAVALLKELPAQVFEDPASSADAGLVYAAAGRSAEARSLLEMAHAHAPRNSCPRKQRSSIRRSPGEPPAPPRFGRPGRDLRMALGGALSLYGVARQ